MNPEAYKAFRADYQDAQSEKEALLAYKTRYEAFCRFISQGECVKVVNSRERQSGKLVKRYIIVKNPEQPILIVKLPLHGVVPERRDMLYWTQPKDFTDQVVLLAIKKPDRKVVLLKKKFKDADGKSCPTIFFVKSKLNLPYARGRLNEVDDYLKSNREAFEATDVAKMLSATIKPMSRSNWRENSK